MTGAAAAVASARPCWRFGLLGLCYAHSEPYGSADLCSLCPVAGRGVGSYNGIVARVAAVISELFGQGRGCGQAGAWRVDVIEIVRSVGTAHGIDHCGVSLIHVGRKRRAHCV